VQAKSVTLSEVASDSKLLIITW